MGFFPAGHSANVIGIMGDMTPTRQTITTRGPGQTRAFGRSLAEQLPPGSVLALHGELGSGKTCFVQGLAEGLGISAIVNSPTYTLIHEYRGARPLYHIDLYRVRSADEALGLGLEEYLQPDGITAIEWADRVTDWLPPNAWHVRFQIGGQPDERTIQLEPGV
jgi:tRNA threonylcarbamoyladenosine biosynthesis protein TsaE